MKRFGRAFLGFIFFGLLTTVAVLAAVSIVFGTPERIKQGLSDNQVYAKAVDTLIEEVQNSTKSEGEGDSVPVGDPAVQQAIREAFPATTLQSAGENVIEGMYGWLSGDTKTPEFNIELAESKVALANGVSKVAAARLQSLPPCTRAQLATLDRNNINPFEVPCLPPGIDITAEQQKLAGEIASSSEFLEDTSFNATDLPKNESGQTAVDQLSSAPTIFQLARMSPLLFTVLLLIVGSVWMLLFDEKRKGFRALAWTLIGAAVFLFIMFGIFGFGFSQITKPGGVLLGSNTNPLAEAAAGLARDMSAYLNRIIVWFGFAYLVLGAGTLIALKFIFKDSSAQPSAKK